MKPADKKTGQSRRAWVHAHINDPYVRAAQKDGYRSRAAYKLQEIDQRLGLLRPGATVVDLGCAPGAWSQYARRRLRAGQGGALAGRIVALDLLPMQPIDGVQYIQGDFRDSAVLHQLVQALHGGAADVVLSDMAPNLSGHASVDAARVAHLVELAVDFCTRHLQPGGSLLLKAFHGSGYDALVALLRQTFVQVKPLKPKASRGQSAEAYLWGNKLRKL